MRPENIARVESEAGVIATLVYHPQYAFYSENLLPNHFSNKANRYIYAALCLMARQGATCADAYGILQALQSSEATASYAQELTVEQLNDFLDNCESLARHTAEDYSICVKNVLDAAFRRDTLKSLKKCEDMC